MILVDTSVWIDHLRDGDAQLIELLERSNVVMHPMVLGELACGNLRDRQSLLDLWQQLPQLAATTDSETLYFLQCNHLWGRGIGYIDLHLLASTSLNADTKLWSRDKRLQKAARQLELSFIEYERRLSAKTE